MSVAGVKSAREGRLEKCATPGVEHLSKDYPCSCGPTLTGILNRIYLIYMITRVLFNIDKKLKAAAMRKAKSQGLTYSAVLNLATRAYVNDEIAIDALSRDLAEARADIRAGQTISQEALFKELGL
jgi:antitoxin component of RelBE/YafQ-DinJ toxin-antitoxin module